jgi:copper chaperone
MTERTLSVEGMSCGGCESAVVAAIEDIDGVTSARADHEAKAVTVELDGTVSDDQLAGAISEAGYELVA